MKLYYSKGACSLAVRIVINEIGVACKYEAVDLKSKQTEKSENYLKINPKGAVPALLIDDKEVLTENLVIQQYLAEKNKAYKLLPQENDFNRYRVLEWANFVSTELHKSFTPLFHANISEEEKEKVFIPLLKKKLEFVDQALKDKDYLMGEDFTLPDAYLFVMLFWLRHFKIDLAAYPNLASYFAKLKKRDSIQKSLQEENFSL